jgi:hypothetical protein
MADSGSVRCNLESIGPVLAGIVSDAYGGAEHPEGVRSALLIGHIVPVLYAYFVWQGRTALEAEQFDTHQAMSSVVASAKYHKDSQDPEMQPLCTTRTEACAQRELLFL